MIRPNRSVEELRNASEHLHYEIWIFQGLAREMERGTAQDIVIKNAILESYAVHVRGLNQFF